MIAVWFAFSALVGMRSAQSFAFLAAPLSPRKTYGNPTTFIAPLWSDTACLDSSRQKLIPVVDGRRDQLFPTSFASNKPVCARPVSVASHPVSLRKVRYSSYYINDLWLHPSASLDSAACDEVFRRTLAREAELSSRTLPLKQWWSNGSNVHRVNILLAAASFFLLLQNGVSIRSISKLSLIVSYAGLFTDNAVRAAGKVLGEGIILRRLSKLCCVLHGASVPMVAVVVTEIAGKHGLLFAKTKTLLQTAWLALALIKCTRWILFDSSEMKVADNRRLTVHNGRYLAGTLAYTSGKVLECMLPVFAIVLYQIGMAGAMLKNKAGGIAPGVLLLISALAAIFVCSFNRPDVQSLGETFYIGSVFAHLAAM